MHRNTNLRSKCVNTNIAGAFREETFIKGALSCKLSITSSPHKLFQSESFSRICHLYFLNLKVFQDTQNTHFSGKSSQNELLGPPGGLMEEGIIHTQYTGKHSLCFLWYCHEKTPCFYFSLYQFVFQEYTLQKYVIMSLQNVTSCIFIITYFLYTYRL